MGHSDSLKNVPNVDSKEFENFLKDNGFDKKFFNEDFTSKPGDINNSLNDNTAPDQPKKESIGKIIDNWCTNNQKLFAAIILGGSLFFYYKMTIGIISQGVFKGNLKTARYFNKYSMQ